MIFSLEQEKLDARNKRLQEKEDEKARKAEEKAARSEEKRIAKEEKRRSKHDPAVSTTEPTDDTPQEPIKDFEEATEEPEEAGSGNNLEQINREVKEEPESTKDGEASDPELAEEASRSSVDAPVEDKAASEEKPQGPGLIRSPTAKVRGWIKNRFSRGKSMSEDRKRGSFMGGASLKSGAGGSSASIEDRQLSTHESSLGGGENETTEGDTHETQIDAGDVSSLSSDDLDDSDGEGVEPPRVIKDPAVRTSSSPNRDSRFREEIGN